jgi:pectate lyase
MSTPINSRAAALVAAFLLPALASCGLDAGGTSSPAGQAGGSVAVKPPSAEVQISRSVDFTATLSAEVLASVAWTVEPQGCGTVTATGAFTAPATARVCTVRATSTVDSTKTGTATVTVTADPPPGGEVLAFPGAEGFGARATGGRGGRVIKVTNLNTSGAGSLQAALDVNAPRIIVFAVSGVIRGNVEVTHGNVTIAGQTAPGGGITIAGRLAGAYDYAVQNIVVRHLRVRPPRCGTGCDASQYDAIQFSRNNNLILDHISVAYGADETIDVYEADDVTVQWTTIEPSQVANHPDGTSHNYGFISGPDAHRISFHHNLCAHHSRRCPAIANGPADLRNNVAYNVRHAFIHNNPAQGDFNFVGNYFKQGPNDSLLPYFFDDEDTSAGTRTSYYLRDSYVDDPGQLVGSVDNPWTNSYFSTLNLDASYRSATEFDFRTVVANYVPITTQTATAAYELVLGQAGAFPRDGFTLSTVASVRARNGGWNPDLPADLMAGLAPASAPTDADGDGMADAWELAHGLDPTNGTDHSKVMPSGYTAIEDYVNGLAAAIVN